MSLFHQQLLMLKTRFRISTVFLLISIDQQVKKIISKSNHFRFFIAIRHLIFIMGQMGLEKVQKHISLPTCWNKQQVFLFLNVIVGLERTVRALPECSTCSQFSRIDAMKTTFWRVKTDWATFTFKANTFSTWTDTFLQFVSSSWSCTGFFDRDKYLKSVCEVEAGITKLFWRF